MVKFEIKKVFLRRGNQMAVALLALLLCVVCFFAGNISYVNESGETETGFQAVKKLREEQKEWAGLLDEVKIRKVIEENNKISQTPEAKSEDFQENDKAFHKKQGFQEIRNLLNYAYAEGFRDYNYFRADSLKPEDASEFYENRIVLLKEWLSGEGKMCIRDSFITEHSGTGKRFSIALFTSDKYWLSREISDFQYFASVL